MTLGCVSEPTQAALSGSQRIASNFPWRFLHVGPKAYGTISERVRAIKLQMGAWLKINSGALNGSRSWLFYGEGSTRVTSSALNSDQQEFSSEDIFFTARNGMLYTWYWLVRKRPLARAYAQPSTPCLKGPVSGVQLLGSSDRISWN